MWGNEPAPVTSVTVTRSTHAPSKPLFSHFPAHIEAHLRYPHCWVWLTASQLFGQLFAAHRAEQLVAVWRGEGEESPQPAATDFITSKLDKKVRKCSSLRGVSISSSYPLKRCRLLSPPDQRAGSVLLLSAAVQVPGRRVRRAGTGARLASLHLRPVTAVIQVFLF